MTYQETQMNDGHTSEWCRRDVRRNGYCPDLECECLCHDTSDEEGTS